MAFTLSTVVKAMEALPYICSALLVLYSAARADSFPTTETPSDEARTFANVWCRSCACGIPNKETRVIGGSPTLVNEYPWVVAISMKGKFFCGGTLINDLYVLTAAHCVINYNQNDLIVVLSEHNKVIMNETQTEIKGVSKVIAHPDFNKYVSYDNDIALLKLSSRVMFRPNVSPACLPFPEIDFTGSVGRITGWGVTTEGGTPATELMEAQVHVLDNHECRRLNGFSAHRLTNNMMCAGVEGGGKDACQGDSGGALLIENWRGQLTAAGIVSWGLGCARPNKPGVYTRVNQYLLWIIRHTTDACYCI